MRNRKADRKDNSIRDNGIMDHGIRANGIRENDSRSNGIRDNFIKRHKGYTLVELVVVVAILLILSSAIIIGATQWIIWSQFKQQNEYAKTIFLAAQNQMTQWTAQGQLADIDEMVTIGGIYRQALTKTQLTKEIKDCDGNHYDFDKLWPQRQGKEEIDKNKYSGDIVFLRAKKGEYQAYKENPASITNKCTRLLFSMLEDSLYDPTILNAAVCVEFSPQSGQIFAVLYSNRAEEFVYRPNHKWTERIVDISDRTTSVRKSRMVGYYGVDTLSRPTTTRAQKPAISDVLLHNEETLNLSFRLSRVPEAIYNLEYTITVCDKKTKNARFSFVLNGQSLLSKQCEKVKVTRYYYVQGSGPKPDKKVLDDTLECNIIAWADDDTATVRVILDAADLTATADKYVNMRYKNNLYKEKTDSIVETTHGQKLHYISMGAESGAGAAVPDSVLNFQNTMSIRRFGFDLEEIFCEVQAQGAYYAKTSKRTSNEEHASFASVKEDKEGDVVKGYTYGIANARHLYNMRYQENDSNPDSKELTYQLVSNFRWDTFVEKGYLYDTKNTRGEAGITPDMASYQPVSNKRKVTASPAAETGEPGTFTDPGESSLPEEEAVSAAETGDPDTTTDPNDGTEQPGGEASPAAGEEQTETVRIEFPSIPCLRKVSSLRSEHLEATHTIRGLALSEDMNAKCAVYSVGDKKDEEGNLVWSADGTVERSNIANGPVGLFAESYGNIESVTLDQIYVEGTKEIGAFCGISHVDITGYTDLTNAKAVMKNLTVNSSKSENPSTITVKEGETDSTKYKDYASTGGIVGKIEIKDYIPYIKSTDDSDPQDADSQDTNPQDADPQDTDPQDADSQDATPQDTISQQKVSVLYENLVNRAKVSGYYCVGGITGDVIIKKDGSTPSGSGGGAAGGGTEGSGTEGTEGGTTGNDSEGTEGGTTGGGTEGTEGGTAGGDTTEGGTAGTPETDPEPVLAASEDSEELVSAGNANSKKETYVSASRVLLSSCNNYGPVQALTKNSKYIGGIVGKTENRGEDPRDITLEQCVSSPYYSSEEIEDIFDLAQKRAADDGTSPLDDYLNGIYVGGIVGYSINTNMAGCSTKNERNRQGYIFGYCYVGGIIGLYESGTAEGNTFSGSETDKGVNEAYVIGDYYVGGIVGCNSVMSGVSFENRDNSGMVIDGEENQKKDDEIVYVPSTKLDKNRILKNWENRGIVAAKTKCAGGIVGMNSGILENCRSIVSYNNLTKRISETETLQGDYIGGIAGYNNGEIVTTEGTTIGLICNVIGKSFVGGIVGYNDVGAIITGYKLTGGYVTGKGYFVGGYAGLNCSREVLEQNIISANPNKVQGKYCVGGSIGGNILAVNEEIETDFDTDNFLGNVIGDAFVGGFIGYNKVIPSHMVPENYAAVNNARAAGNVIEKDTEKAYLAALKADVLNILLNHAELMMSYQSESEDPEQIYKDIINNLNAAAYTEEYLVHVPGIDIAANKEYAGRGLYINGKKDGNDTAMKLGSVRADIYVGGIVGYNDENTTLKVSDIINKTPVMAQNNPLHYTADEATRTIREYVGVSSANDSDLITSEWTADDNDGEIPVYTITVIDKETQEEKTYYCAEKERTDSTEYNPVNKNASYSYAGGIIGKVSHKVTIENCSNQGLGDVTTRGTYLGGICELNRGTIINCEVASIGNISHDYIGGIVGLNYADGTINESILSERTVTGRNYVGGIVAENHGIIENTDISNAAVRATGSYVGGAAGINYGEILLSRQKIARDTAVVNTDNNGVTEVTANEASQPKSLLRAVQSTDSDSFSYEIYVRASGDYVGGVAGENQGSICAVNETTAASGQDAGNNAGETEFAVQGVIEGDQYVGGITGKNCKKQTEATELSEPDSEQTETAGLSGLNNEASVVARNGFAAGIAGESDSAIENCTNKGIVSADLSGDAGGIVANNSNEVINCHARAAVTSSNGNAGGIAAVNKKGGSIQNCTAEGTKSSDGTVTQLAFSGDDYVGGLVGINHGDIAGGLAKYVQVSNLPDSDESHIGVFAGSNTGKILPYNPSLYKNRALPDYLSSVNPAAEDSTVMIYTTRSSGGGIAGSNAGIISKAEITNHDSTAAAIVQFAPGSGGLFANMGGIAGINSGTIQKCAVKANITGNMGNEEYGYGGIAGVSSGSKSVIENCTYNGTVQADGTATYIVSIGGIAGRNEGMVSHSYIGTKTDTKVCSGYGTKDTAMGYVGGLVGMNYGDVIDCDNYEYSKNKVEIINFAGHTGGIVANQLKGAFVSGKVDSDDLLSTGFQWSVTVNKYSNDAGSGGIIGYSASEKDMTHIKNYADVTVTQKTDNVGCGGLVGRLENKERSTLLISDFENYGAVKGSLSGGAIGRLKYKGATLRDCINYGQIQHSNGTTSGYAGGIIASLYANDENTILLVDHCKNYGEIVGFINGAGIIAERNGSSKIAIYVTDCVNEGTIRLSASRTYPDGKGNTLTRTITAAGIAASIANTGIYPAEYYRCRNYGVYDIKKQGDAGNKPADEEKYFSGITSGAYSQCKISECFSITGSVCNNGVAANVKDSYYVGGELATVLSEDDLEEKVYLYDSGDSNIETKVGKAIVAKNSSLAGGTKLASLIKFDGSKTKFSNMQKKPRPEFTIKFDKPYPLTYFRICFANDNAGHTRTYTFKLMNQNGQYLNNNHRWVSEDEAAEFTKAANDKFEDSYWQAKLDGQTEIESLTLKIVEVTDTKPGNPPNWGVFYGFTASVTDRPSETALTFKSLEKVPIPEELKSAKSPTGYMSAILKDSNGKFVIKNIEAVNSFLALDIVKNPILARGDFSNRLRTDLDDDISDRSDRYAVYQEVDPKLETQFYKRKKGKPDGVKNVQAVQESNVIKVKWELAGTNYYTTQLVYEFDGNFSDPISIPYGIQQYTMDLPEGVSGKELKVYVRNINGEYIPGEYSSPLTNNSHASDWVSSSSLQVLEPLPIPQIHFELGAYDVNDKADKGAFVAILDNPEDFEGKETTVTVTFDEDVTLRIIKKQEDNTETEVTGVKSLQFDTKKKRSERFFLVIPTEKEGNRLVTRYADGIEGTYADSASISIQTALFSDTYMNSKVVVGTTFRDFYGDDPSNLYNEIVMSPKDSNMDLYVDSELVIEDYKFEHVGSTLEESDVFHYNLTAAYGNSHVSTRGDSPTGKLSDLPDDLLSHGSITVRTIPWKTQAYICWYGHPVTVTDEDGKERDFIREDELLTYMKKQNLLDKERQNDPVFITEEVTGEDGKKEQKRRLNDGYSLRINTDGTYSVIYNTILANSSEAGSNEGGNYYENQLSKKVYEIIEEDGTTKVISRGLDKNGSETILYRRTVRDIPVIDTEENPLKSDGKSYTFIWDKGKEYWNSKAAEYTIKLTGYKDGNSVFLGQVQVNKDTKNTDGGSCYFSEKGVKYWSYTFVDRDETWNYPIIELSVIRKGSTYSNNDITYIFPSMESEKFEIKARLPQVARPMVTLHETEDGIVDKDTMIYDVAFSAIQENERGELEAYGIAVQPKEDGYVAEYTTEADRDAAYTQMKELYDYLTQGGLTEEERQLTEKLRADIKSSNIYHYWNEELGIDSKEDKTKLTYCWTETVEGAVVERILHLSKDSYEKTAGDHAGKTVYTLKKYLVQFVTFEPDNSKDELKQKVDLNLYEKGEMLNISVQALAKENSTTRRDSVKGVIREFYLPSRLNVPNITGVPGDDGTIVGGMTISPEYSTEDFMTQHDYINKGLWLKMSDRSNPNYQGTFQIAVAVYDKKPEGEDDNPDKGLVLAGDAPDENAEGYWNSGAVETIVKKADAKQMSGEFSEAEFNITDLNTDYAGKWLKVAIRSVSDNNISSWWTDEDDSSYETVNYRWLQIPRLQVEEPVLTQEKSGIFYYKEDTGEAYTLEDGKEPSANDYLTEQTALSFEPQKYADAYKAVRIRKWSLKDEKSKLRKFDADWIYLEKADDQGTKELGDDVYHVFIQSSALEFNLDEEVKDKYDSQKVYSRQDPTAVYWGDISKGKLMQLPVRESAFCKDEEYRDVSMLLSWNEEQPEEGGVIQKIQIILPDAENIDAMGAAFNHIDNYFTTQTSVKAVVFGDEASEDADGNVHTNFYQDSLISSWYQNIGESSVTTKRKTLEDYGKAPEEYEGDAREEVAFDVVPIDRLVTDLTNPGGTAVVTDPKEDMAYELRGKSAYWQVLQVEIADANADADGNLVATDTRYVSAYRLDTDNRSLTAYLPEALYKDFVGYQLRVRTAYVYGDGGGLGKWSEWTGYVTLTERTNVTPTPEPTPEPTETPEGSQTSQDGTPASDKDITVDETSVPVLTMTRRLPTMIRNRILWK